MEQNKPPLSLFEQIKERVPKLTMEEKLSLLAYLSHAIKKEETRTPSESLVVTEQELSDARHHEFNLTRGIPLEDR